MGEQYTELSTLPNGAFGVAKLVQRKKDNVKFVAKLVREREDVDSKEDISKLKNLASHANLVSLIDILPNETKETLLIMEYCPDSTLNDVIVTQKKRMPLDKQKVIMRCVITALTHLHSFDILHLNLKPDNIIVCGETAKVADYGITKSFCCAPNTEQFFHKIGNFYLPKFFTPPGLKESPDNVVSTKVDVYQAGCVFLAMLHEDKVNWINGKKLLAPCLKSKMGDKSEMAGHQSPSKMWAVERMLYNYGIPEEPLKELIIAMTHMDAHMRPDAKNIVIP